MWPLFIAIAVGFLLLLSFAWGLATGTRLGKKTQLREHEAYRAAGERALRAHRLEREAWLSASAPGPHQLVPDGRLEIAERAHVRTRDAFMALAPAWGDFGNAGAAPLPEGAKTASDRAKPAT